MTRPVPLTIPIVSDQTTMGTVAIPGLFSQRITQEIKVVIPNTTNVITFTFSIIDTEGDVRYSVSALPRNLTSLIFIQRIVKPGYLYGITPSGAPGNDITVSIYPDYVETVKLV